MLLIRNIRLGLSVPKEQAIEQAIRLAKLPKNAVMQAEIAKVSVDARKKLPMLVYTVAVRLKEEGAEFAYANSAPCVSLLRPPKTEVKKGDKPLKYKPIVVGLGPAGLFCALYLARLGFEPIVLEQGAEIQKRMKIIDVFRSGGVFDETTNIQFGEGGAGTFSDGKLTTRIGDDLCAYVTQTLLKHGAPKEIAWQQKPHIGTDRLQQVIVSMRKEIQCLGGQILFETKLTGLCIKNGALKAVQTTQGEIPTELLVLAVGHSARDTFEMLAETGVNLQCKPFSVGFRAEHLQTEIEKSLYHDAAGHPALPRGEYQLSHHIGNRCVYTFCMCPGGRVVAAASEEGGVVTNGMSYHARDGKNANAAVVVSVDGNDFAHNPFSAIAFQRKLEQEAFQAGGKNYTAPCENVQSFLQAKGTLKIKQVEPTYCRGVIPYDLGSLLPQELADTLRQGLQAFERKLKGYTAPNAVLTGLETRTSSPVRIPRQEDFQSVDVKGMYPCGEGAGYAGGIVSAAVDGLRIAQAICAQYSPNKKEKS